MSTTAPVPCPSEKQLGKLLSVLRLAPCNLVRQVGRKPSPQYCDSFPELILLTRFVMPQLLIQRISDFRV